MTGALGVQALIADVLNGAVVLGWAFLILTGLETDRPMSGGIPGHVEASDGRAAAREGWVGRASVVAGWLLFGSVSCALPVVLWWVLAMRPR